MPSSASPTASPTRAIKHDHAATVTDVTQVSLCVSVQPAQASTVRGQSAGWTVTAWTTGGDVPDATLRLQAAPVDSGAPGFSFGCGNDNGASSCDLGAVDANSAARQLQVQLTVPAAASTVKSVRLTVTGTAPDLVKAASAAAAVSITAPSGAPTPTTSTPTAQASTGPTSTAPAPTGQAPTGQPSATSTPTSSTPAAQPAPTAQLSAPATASSAPAATPAAPFSVPTTTSPLAVGNLPSIAVPSPSATLSPGGNAGGNAASLFPTLDPSPATSGSARSSIRPVANTAALPEGASTAGAQLAGLAALALAIVVAITRLSIRRRPATPPEGQPGQQPEGQPGQPEQAAPAAAQEDGNQEEEKK